MSKYRGGRSWRFVRRGPVRFGFSTDEKKADLLKPKITPNSSPERQLITIEVDCIRD